MDDYEVLALIKEGKLQALQAAFAAGTLDCDRMPYEQSLVLLAVFEAQTEVLRFLVERGCDVNSGESERGLTPLHAAAQKENYAAAEMLLAAGAQVDAEDYFGNTPLLEAVFVYRREDALPILELLLAHGADPCHANQSDVSACAFAKKTGKEKVLALLKCENCGQSEVL